MLHIKLSLTFLFAFTLLVSKASISVSLPILNSIPEPTEEWQEYTTINDVRIEFKRKTCTPINDREQNLILFRYTNLSSDTQTLSWSTKIWRNDFCVNCERIENPEYAFSITLVPNQVLEGDGSTKADKSVYIFDNFITLIPGMTDDRLTNFELINLIVD
jgi:hypothetical protein